MNTNRRADIIGGLAATALACWLTGLAAESGAFAYAAAALAVCAITLALHAASQTAATIRYEFPPNPPRARNATPIGVRARHAAGCLGMLGACLGFWAAVIWWVLSW